jgi:hypothetical protein
MFNTFNGNILKTEVQFHDKYFTTGSTNKFTSKIRMALFKESTAMHYGDSIRRWNQQTQLNVLRASYTGRFIIFSVTANIYNKKTKGPTLMELFTATGKLEKSFFWQLDMFDVYITGDTAHIDTVLNFLPHSPQHRCIEVSISRGNGGTY